MSTNAQTVDPGNSSEIQTLTQEASRLNHAVDSWNTAYVWFGAFALLVAFLVFFAQYRIIRKGRELSDAQAKLIAAKDLQAATDSKNQDERISAAQKQAAISNEAAGKANAKAGEANERASKANERSSALEVEALKLRLQLAAQGPRESLLRGEVRQKLVDTLKPFSGQKVDLKNSASIIQVNGKNVMSTPIGDDSLGLASALIGVAGDAGWQVPSEPIPTFVTAQGIEILVSRNASEKTLEAAVKLAQALGEVPFGKVQGPVFAEPNRMNRGGSKEMLPAFDNDTIVVEVLTHP